MKLRICSANHKGGVGKTTTTMLTAGAFATSTFSVGVIDLDPQGSAGLWAAASDKFPARVVAATAASLTDALDELSDCDAIFLDCPPSSTAAETLAALDVASLVIIPCIPSAPDYWATDTMVTVAEMRVPATPRLVVINQAMSTNLARDMIETIEKTWPTARARLGSRTAYREAAALGLSLRQLPGRPNRDAIDELDALAVEILTTAMKAA